MCIFNRNFTTINNECLCFHNYLQEIYYQNLLMENHRRTQREGNTIQNVDTMFLANRNCSVTCCSGLNHTKGEY